MSAPAPARQPVEPLAYSIQALADATHLSYETIRQAIQNNELAPKYSGTKAVIPADEARRWLASLPDEKPRSTQERAS